MILRLAPALLLLACKGDKGGDTSAADLPFCEKKADANTQIFETGGGNGESGLVYGRLINNVSDDLHDPQFTAFVEYALENTDVGGAQRQGETNQDGAIQELLGQGNWHLRISAYKGGYRCASEMDFNVKAGDSTNLCIDLVCE